MAVPVAALAKLVAAVLSDEDTRRKLGWIVAAICSPLILTLALICSLLSGSAEHNNSAVLLCFNGGSIPGKTPAEYVAYIEDMRRSFTLLDDAIAAVNDMTENSDSLDAVSYTHLDVYKRQPPMYCMVTGAMTSVGTCSKAVKKKYSIRNFSPAGCNTVL